MEKKRIITIEANREGYGPDQCGSTMTVRELINYLEQFDEDQKVYISNDNGYTYGSISNWDFNEKWEDEEDDE